MSQSEEEFLAELRKTFAVEAEEHLQTIASGLIEIEKKKDAAERQAVTESVYRAAHSLKGAARTVNLSAIGAVCQSLESVFSAMKRGLLTPAAEDFDVLQRAVDGMVLILASPPGDPEPDVTPIIEELDRIAAPGKKASPPPRPTELGRRNGGTERGTVRQNAEEGTPSKGPGPASVPPSDFRPPNSETPGSALRVPASSADTIRIATVKLDAILLQAEELISVKLAAEQRIAELTEVLALFGAWRKEWMKAGAKTQATRRREEKRTRGNARQASPSGPAALPAALEGGDARMREVDARLNALLAALKIDRLATGMLVDQLLEGTKTVLMLPFSTLLKTFPKMVRDISREQGKEVGLVFSGGEIEIDKRILERMKDPLIHMLRNSMDHGFEKPDVRKVHQKSPGGTLTVAVSQAEGNRVQIVVSDDGAGIDAAKLRELAVKRGLLLREAADALDDQAAVMLIFQSGISTSPLITDLSGRGLGMAIVQEAVDKLGGRIAVETTKGKGTTFRISLPLTLATFRGMLLREYGQLFVVPTASVERALRVRPEDVRTVENRETILVNGEPLALVRLGAALGLTPPADEAGEPPLLSVIVLSAGHREIAFSVDTLLQEQEILIKGLGRQLERVRNIAGATVLGSGKVVPVLNVADLLKSSARVGRAVSAPQAAKTVTQRKSMLVVEDSITSRMLIKNILSSAGFDVHTVVDGVEAWTVLRERGFDAVVSDIEMPRMNGFDLTARIRADAKLAALPVVLVTSLESQPDRERGIEVGADAYIVKSSFDQSNLLDVVRRLI